jgi:hypothetical protein
MIELCACGALEAESLERRRCWSSAGPDGGRSRAEEDGVDDQVLSAAADS